MHETIYARMSWLEAGIRTQAQLAEARLVEPKASCDVKESAEQPTSEQRVVSELAGRQGFEFIET